MEFQISPFCSGTRVDRLKGRAIFKHGGSFYRVVDSSGQGVTLEHSPCHVVIVNLKTGTLREIKGSIHVEPLRPCKEQDCFQLELVPKHDLYHYLK